jgi:hypothetical protein
MKCNCDKKSSKDKSKTGGKPAFLMKGAKPFKSKKK